VIFQFEDGDVYDVDDPDYHEFGYTSSGRYLAVVWEHVDDNPLTLYPITAYDAPDPEGRA
jgi:hypothetical protein